MSLTSLRRFISYRSIVRITHHLEVEWSCFAIQSHRVALPSLETSEYRMYMVDATNGNYEKTCRRRLDVVFDTGPARSDGLIRRSVRWALNRG